MEGFRQDVETIHLMGFDGKSIINPLVIIHPAGIIQVCISSDPLSVQATHRPDDFRIYLPDGSG